jgi:hypothetical protein
MPEIVFKAFLSIRGQAQRPNMDYFRVKEGFGIRLGLTDHRIHQVLRFAAGGRNKNAIASVDMVKNLGLRDKFVRVFQFSFI